MRLLDSRGKGFLEVEDLRRVMKASSIAMEEGNDEDINDAETVITQLDSNHDGRVEYEE